MAADALAALLGQGGTSSTDEIAWAFRKLLEAVAAEGPLVAVFDDIQWGEDVFLDLLEHVAFLSTGAPILLLCMARPELLDRRGGWGGVVRLQPLGPTRPRRSWRPGSAARELEHTCASGSCAPRAATRSSSRRWRRWSRRRTTARSTVPPTLQALLAARLDQLDAPERSVLERGAVEGEVFHQGVVQALTPEEPRLTTRLTALVRKELIRPDRPLFIGEDAFRFRHLLMRDAAYEACRRPSGRTCTSGSPTGSRSTAPSSSSSTSWSATTSSRRYRYLQELGRPMTHAGARGPSRRAA